MFISVVIPTYNRLPILRKCLLALEEQINNPIIENYEIIVVDDGSNDETIPWLSTNKTNFPHLKLIEQLHAGPGAARNLGVENAKGNVIIFIDSDLVVDNYFLSAHAITLSKYWDKLKHRYCFTYGSVINTNNFEYPQSESFKLNDLSWAYFATGNVAIDKQTLLKSGLFDPAFKLYGWEDLELGERLRQMGVKLIKCPKAVGYHWHPPLRIEQITNLIRIEKERAKMALVFYRKHPSFRVRLIIQFTIFHRLLWEVLTLGGLFNHVFIRPLIKFLLSFGYSSIAMELFRVPLNLIYVRQIYREAYRNGIS